MCSFHFCCYFQGLLKKDLFSNLSKTLISPLVSKLGCACHLTFFLLQFSSWCVCIKLQNYKWLLLCLCKRTVLKETSRKVCIKDRKPSLFIHLIFPGWWTTCHGTLLLYLRFFFFFFFHSQIISTHFSVAFVEDPQIYPVSLLQIVIVWFDRSPLPVWNVIQHEEESKQEGDEGKERAILMWETCLINKVRYTENLDRLS